MRERNAFEKAILGNKKALQGGVYNYLGKQKTVNAPLKWKSSPSHPVAYLTYITKEEIDILIKKNIYGSLKNGKPNKGPFGIASLQGSGSGSEGAGTGDGPGTGAAEGTAQGPGPNEGGEAAQAAANAAEVAGVAGLGQQDTFGSDVDPENVMSSTTPQNEEEEEDTQSKPTTSMARLSPIGRLAYSRSLANPEKSATEKAVSSAISPIGTMMATFADIGMRGVTGPSDDTQEQESVQTGPTPGLGSGIGSFENTYKPFENTYKPLDNLNVYMPYTRKPFFTIDPLTGVLKSLI